MGMYYYMPWTPQKNDTNDENDEDDEDDENGEDWLLSRITPVSYTHLRAHET